MCDIRLGPGSYVTPSVSELRWLSVTARIKYKFCPLVHKAVFGHMPVYIADLLTPVDEISLHSVCLLRDTLQPGGQD